MMKLSSEGFLFFFANFSSDKELKKTGAHTSLPEKDTLAHNHPQFPDIC